MLGSHSAKTWTSGIVVGVLCAVLTYGRASKGRCELANYRVTIGQQRSIDGGVEFTAVLETDSVLSNNVVAVESSCHCLTIVSSDSSSSREPGRLPMRLRLRLNTGELGSAKPALIVRNGSTTPVFVPLPLSDLE